jgi:hypothetical protein
MNLSTADLRNYRTEFHETWWSYRYMFLVGSLPNWPLTLSTHISNFDDIGQCWIFTPPFLCRVLAAIFTGQNFMKLGGVIDIGF